MKKIVVGLTFLIAVCSSYAQKDPYEQAAIQEFVQSAEFAKARTCVKIPGYDIASLAIINTYVKYANDNKNAPILYVQIGTGRPGSSMSRLIGEFQVAKVSSNYRSVPNGGKYLINLRDYSQYDVGSSTGEIKYYDINYDCYLAGVMNVQSGSVVQWDAFGMPREIMVKYNFNGFNESPDKANHYCDLNQNGDISWGECYKCMRASCYSDALCRELCEFTNKNPLPVLQGQCKISMATACVFIAIAM